MSLYKAIGGYYELGAGTNDFSSFHKNYYAINSCRNALLILLQTKKIKFLNIPYYTCSVLLDTLNNSNVKYAFYNINTQLEIENEPTDYNAFLLYTNYFGIKDNYIKKLSSKYANLIIDNAQAFFSEPINRMDTVYSPRKFFGLPDGGFLFTKEKIDLEKYSIDSSYDRCSHLLKRVDLSAEEGYKDFQINDAELENQPIKTMSKLTSFLLRQIDYNEVIRIRKVNFNYLHRVFHEINLLDFDLEKDTVPMVYPLLIHNGAKHRNLLIENRIYTAIYWPNVLELSNELCTVEVNIATNLLPLPIDHRYNKKDLDRIIHFFLNQ